jgi:hypothetical protein
MTRVSVAAAKGRLFHGRRALRKAFTLKDTSEKRGVFQRNRGLM